MPTKIGLVLHAYQPPTQDKVVLERIFRESYEPVIAFLEHTPGAFLSMDIAKSVAETWPKEFLARIRSLYLARRIELVNTAAYHYLLPLVPQETVGKQLRLNLEFYREHFTWEAQVPGVWPPELAIDPSVLKAFVYAGYSWALADDVPFIHSRRHLPGAMRAPANWVPVHGRCGLMLRSREWSEAICERYEDGAAFARALLAGQSEWRESLAHVSESYIILARDFETFGHHHRNAVERFLAPFFREIAHNSTEASVLSVDAIYRSFPKVKADGPIAGSWATWPGDLDAGIPYPLWNHPADPFHGAWNEFLRTAYQGYAGHITPRLTDLFDKAFYSCSPWQHAHGNKEVAHWCLPMFKEIADILSVPKLQALCNEMDRLTR